LGEELDRSWRVAGPLTTVRHSITHHRITAVAHEVEDGGPTAADVEWLSPAEAAQRGLTAATTKILDRLPTLL
jgi:hypothetical protein